MPLGPLSELRQWKQQLNEKNRLIDIAVKFEVFERKHSRPVSTGEFSQTYGGKWDVWTAQYVDYADEKNILVLPCSAKQLEGIESDLPKVEQAGGRGAGKSEGGILKVLKFIADRPDDDGRILSPSFPLVSVVRTKLLEQLYTSPVSWIASIKKQDKEIWFKNGVRIKFASSTDPNSLRSDGFGWTFVDEAQDVSTEAIDVSWFCLRESSDPRLWMSLTAAPGEAYKRHIEYEEDPDAATLVFDSYSNPFISKRVFDLAKKRMD